MKGRLPPLHEPQARSRIMRKPHAGIAPLIAVTLFCCVLNSVKAARAADAAGPVVMELNTVTLELECRDGAMAGEFLPIRAQIVEADTWGGNQQSHADLTGYEGQAGLR